MNLPRVLAGARHPDVPIGDVAGAVNDTDTSLRTVSTLREDQTTRRVLRLDALLDLR